MICQPSRSDRMPTYRSNAGDGIPTSAADRDDADQCRRWANVAMLAGKAPLLYYIKLYESFKIHRWIQTGVTVQKRSIRVKIGDFLSRVTLKFDGWPWKTIGHLFYSTLSFVYHFKVIGIQCKPDISRSRISRNWIYRGRMLDPIFWHPRARYFSQSRGNSLEPIRGRQFFTKSAHRDSLCSRFAGDNFSRNQLKPTCQCGLEHMLCDGQPR